MNAKRRQKNQWAWTRQMTLAVGTVIDRSFREEETTPQPPTMEGDQNVPLVASKFQLILQNQGVSVTLASSELVVMWTFNTLKQEKE